MAKKTKKPEDKAILTTADVDSANVLEVLPAEPMGKGVGVYYDSKLKKFVMVTLDIVPDGEAHITSRQKLNSSKLNATLKATITLEQLLNKLK